MKSHYISQLKAGDKVIDEAFLVQDVVHRQTKDGRRYLLLTLSDRTGQANGIYWDTPDDLDNWIRAGLVVLISGRIGNYKEALQISASAILPCATPDMTDFLGASRRSRDEMIAELRREVEGLGRPWQELAAHILLEDSFLNRLANAPAAKRMHHAYVGGLLEHTLSMAAVGHHLAIHYPHVNEQLLVAGILMHDVGKVIEYTIETSISTSDDGRLLGHIVQGVITVERAAAALADFPEAALNQLIHLMASHHGSLEYGSPVVPKTLEAVLLHQIDLLDSRVQGFYDHVRSDASNELWSHRSSPMFNTELRRPPGLDSS